MGNTTQTHSYLWWSPDGVNMYPVSVSEPLPVQVVTGGGSNASVGLIGQTAPTSATEIGIVDDSGNLEHVSNSNPLPVTLDSAFPATVAISQVTPGSTNAVDATNFPVTVDTNSGNPGSSTLRTVTATVAVTPTDRGGTITTGGTAQNAAGANASRKNMTIQNPVDATEDLYVAVSGTATVGGAGNFADLAPGGSVTLRWDDLIIQSAVSVVAATTGHRFLATEMQ